MKILISAVLMGTVLLISLVDRSAAQEQTYAGAASGSSADGPRNHYQKRAATTTTELTPPPTTNPDAESLTPPEPQEKPPKPNLPQPPRVPFPFPRPPGSAAGSGAGAFPGFPSFPFPSQPYAPLPYYGFNPAFPFSFPFNQAAFTPFPLFDFNTYNQQLQNWIKANELQAQQAAANDNKSPSNSPSFGSAAAQGFFGPQGGFGQTFVYPAPQDGQSVTYNRIAPPPPGANRFGVSSFSSSSFSDNNGDKKGNQFSSVSVDDNGNITTIVSSDPSNNLAAVAAVAADNV